MGQYLIKEGFIPLDKSWIIRMGILDLINGYNDTINYLEKHSKDLGDDLKALLKVPKQGNSNKPLEEGESGTLYRFLKFASWKLKKDKKFILEGTLKNRKICDNSKIINYLTNELLKIDNGTSQWASASVLLGNLERISNPHINFRQLMMQFLIGRQQEKIRKYGDQNLMKQYSFKLKPI